MVCHCEILCIILKLHFSRFLKHVSLITLKIRRLLVQLLCVFGPHFWITCLRYVCITSLNNVTATFRFCLLLRCNFITYFILFDNFTFVQMVSFFDDVRVTFSPSEIRETGRIQPKWEDLLVGWRETVGL